MYSSDKSFYAQVAAVFCAALFLFTGAFAQAQSGELTASVDREQVSVEETLTLRVRYTGQVQSGQPDFSLLEENFDIISRQQSNQISTINGVMSSFTEWTLIIAPKKTGELLIPSFKYNGKFSDAIQVSVTKASAPPGQLKDIFVETEISEPRVYVQEQLVLVYRLYTTRSIDSLDAEPLEIDGVRIEELPQTRYQRRIDGVNYGVLEVPYALFPQTSDSFTIPSLRWTVRAVTSPSQRSFAFGASRYELKRLVTEEENVQVEAQPSAYPPDATWLPAQKVTLNEQWSSPPSEFRVGEPLTRTITLRAEGLTASQLPPLPIDQNPQRFRLYADQPTLDNEKNASGITGIRTESMAVVPNQAGEMTLPPVQVTWWDTTTDTLRTAEIPARTFYVQGGAGDAANTGAQEETQQRTPAPDVEQDNPATTVVQGPTSEANGNALLWQLLALLLALLCLLFAWLWWRARRRLAAGPVAAASPHPQNSAATQEKQAFKALQIAGQVAGTSQNLANLRHLLLRWGASRWPHSSPKSLQELAHLLDDAQLRDHLRALDASLFGQNGSEVDSKALVDNISKWRAQHKTASANVQQNLRPLYRA